jgi:alpha-galactosidase
MKKVLQQLTGLNVFLGTAIFSIHFNCLQAQDIKVNIKTVQNQDLKAEVKTNEAAKDKVFAINLSNQTSADQNLKTINITITPQAPIADGTPYVKGADQMGDHEGQMMQYVTGKKASYNNSNMYLMFKRSEQDYLLVGLVSWRTFLCNITTSDGRIIIEGDGDNKQIQAGKRVPFDKVVYMQGASWQDLLDRYADMITKENQLAPAKKVSWTGWSTWDFYVQKFVPEDVTSNMEAFKNVKVNTNIIQMDGGWWKQRGDYFDVRDNIPGGIKSLVEKIHKAGYKAGLHFDGMRVSKGATIVKDHPEYFIHTNKGDLLEMGRDPITKDPLVLWDYSHPGATAYITKAMKNAKQDWKVDYFKIDFLRHGLFKGVSHLPVTNVERFRMGIKAMKQGFGNDVYFLTCSANFGTIIGLADGNRMGGDIHPNYETVKTRAQHTSASYYLSPKVFNIDPDYLVVRGRDETNERDGKKPTLTNDEAAMWSNYVSIYGNARFESDNVTLLKPEKKKLVETSFSRPFFTKIIPMDLWDHYKSFSDAPNFYLTKTDNGIICLGLFNWDDKDATFIIEGFKQTGAFKELNGTAQTKLESNRVLVPLKGVHSILLQYQGKETFDQLRKQLKVTVQR